MRLHIAAVDTPSHHAPEENELYTLFQHTGTAAPLPYPYLCDTAAGPNGRLYMVGHTVCAAGTAAAAGRLHPPMASARWTKHLRATGDVAGLSIAPDRRGGFYVAGWSAGGPMDFGGTALKRDGGHLFLARFDGDGRARWVTGVAPMPLRRSLLPFLHVRVAATPDGHAYVSGGLNLRSPQRFVLARYADDGARQWRHTRSSLSALDLATDAAGRAVVAGAFCGAPELPGRTLRPRPRRSAYAARFGADGQCEWTAQPGALSGESAAYAVAADAAGGLRLAGSFRSSLRFAPGLYVDGPARHDSFFATSFAPDGLPDWLCSDSGRSPGGAAPAEAATGGVAGKSVAVDREGTAYVVGTREEVAASPHRVRRSRHFITAYAASGVEKWSVATPAPVRPDAACLLTTTASGRVRVTMQHTSEGFCSGRLRHYPLTQRAPQAPRVFRMRQG